LGRKIQRQAVERQRRGFGPVNDFAAISRRVFSEQRAGVAHLDFGAVIELLQQPALCPHKVTGGTGIQLKNRIGDRDQFARPLFLKLLYFT